MSKTPKETWRNSVQIKATRKVLSDAIELNSYKNTVHIHIKTAKNLLEICDQAVHTEEGHEMP